MVLWLGEGARGRRRWTSAGRSATPAPDKVLSFGLPTEGKARWGGGCVKGARGGGDGRQEEVRGLLTEAAKFWTAGGGEKVKARWCGGCAKVHVGAVQVGSKKGRGWLLQLPSCGLSAEGKAWRYSGWAKAHVGAVGVARRHERGGTSDRVAPASGEAPALAAGRCGEGQSVARREDARGTAGDMGHTTPALQEQRPAAEGSD